MSSSSSKRQSILPRGAPSGPKAPVNFSSSIIIADSALLAGHHTINISSESVVHPRARLDSANGRVTIGRRCIVHERTVVGAAPSMSSTPNPNPNPTPPSVPAVDSLRSGGDGSGSPSASGGVMIHDYATIEVNAVIESGGTVIGEGTVVGVGCKIGKGAKIGKVSRVLLPNYHHHLYWIKMLSRYNSASCKRGQVLFLRLVSGEIDG